MVSYWCWPLGSISLVPIGEPEPSSIFVNILINSIGLVGCTRVHLLCDLSFPQNLRDPPHQTLSTHSFLELILILKSHMSHGAISYSDRSTRLHRTCTCTEI